MASARRTCVGIGGEGTAQSKIAALKAAGITVSDSPAAIGEAVERVLN